ncbi:MAG TPA: hypothetical protein VGC31_03100, partial [Paenirhodobacter sp.]
TMADADRSRLRHDGAERTAYPADWIGRFAESYRLQDQAWADACGAGTRAEGAATARDGLLATGYCDQLVALLGGARAGALILPEASRNEMKQ